MAMKALRPCRKAGCSNLTRQGYCEQHKCLIGEDDRRRGTAHQRGYTSRWAKYSKWFLSQPGNQLCKLKLDDGCAYIAECVDHIQPVNSPNDPLFFEPTNHQPSCIHCNSVKGHRNMSEVGRGR